MLVCIYIFLSKQLLKYTTFNLFLVNYFIPPLLPAIHTRTSIRRPTDVHSGRAYEGQYYSILQLLWTSTLDVRRTSKVDVHRTSKVDVRRTSKVDVRRTSKVDVRRTSKVDVRKTSKVDVRKTSKSRRP